MKEFKPNSLFNNGEAFDGVCVVKNGTATLGVSTDNILVAANSTKIIQLISLLAFTATGTFNFKDGVGGSALGFGPVAPVTPVLILPPNELGWLRTSINKALVVDVAAAVVNFMYQYIEYTPQQG